MCMMTPEQMRKRKQELGYSYEKIAELTGVPVGTVQKVLSGITKTPRHETLKALEAAFPVTRLKYQYDTSEGSSMVRGSESAYDAGDTPKKDGEYTLEDYYAIPDERRVELIDGVIYDMASPTTIHQMISAELAHILRNEVVRRGASCIVFAAPSDVQLDCDLKTMLQPDVFVVCDRSKIIRRNIYGAPDFIIEILSASTRKKDMNLKAYKYENAGVREYWIIDPDDKKVLVYDFEHSKMPVIYGFEDKIPVMVFGDGFCVDFNEIYNYISFLYEVEE